MEAAVTRGTADRVDVFVVDRATRHTVRHYWDGRTWRTEDLGSDDGRSRLTAASWGPERVDLFYRGANDRLVQRLKADWSGGWTGEIDLGGRLTGTPAAVSWGPNRIDVFYRGQDGR
ncbi:hypothetical protein [Streptomyces sp. NPDC056194]|uniref:hypothetical protein n=1 Tax=unclassified Streptomyces TaxID=2593676 RepID=UPI0035E0417A